jgi:hypothetical protein
MRTLHLVLQACELEYHINTAKTIQTMNGSMSNTQAIPQRMYHNRSMTKLANLLLPNKDIAPVAIKVSIAKIKKMMKGGHHPLP